jgi:hypothetical protein
MARLYEAARRSGAARCIGEMLGKMAVKAQKTFKNRSKKGSSICIKVNS